MATQIEKFDSKGGFSVGKTIVVDELRNAKDINTLELKNSNFTDSNTTRYILRGLNTSTLDLDGLGTKIPIANSTLNFITGNIIAVNDAGTVYATKFETAVSCDGSGNVTVMSSFQTVIKDDIPSGETWNIVPTGGTNNFSYNTTRAGTTSTIKWVSSTEVISIAWA
jgi:hypothetical protein|tara:strand:+ start:6686 stop:7186 length:501 start_codon:yes stop_codon:yes gene_type:complete